MTDNLIRPFAKWVTKKLPWVIAKVGASLDGRITRPPGESQWITSPAAREDAHHLRSEVDAILIGAETLRSDDPALTIEDHAPYAGDLGHQNQAGEGAALDQHRGVG